MVKMEGGGITLKRNQSVCNVIVTYVELGRYPLQQAGGGGGYVKGGQRGWQVVFVLLLFVT